MPLDLVTPGGELSPGTAVSVPLTRGVADLSGLPKFPSRAALVAGRAQILRPKGGADIQITIRGLNVVEEHWAAFQALIGPWMAVAQNRAGELMVQEAQATLRGERELQRAWLTGDTERSVHYFMTTTPNTVMISVGPTTFYAPLIEHGLAEHEAYGPRPFMLRSARVILPGLIQAYADLARVARFGGHARVTSPRYKSDLGRLLARWRKFLYTAEKQLGDIAVLGFGGARIPGTGAFRGGLLGGARVIGDIQAVMGKVVGRRFSRRLTGKVTGRLIGIGSRTIFLNQVSTARITGAERAYNRIAGRAVTKYIDQSDRLGGR